MIEYADNENTKLILIFSPIFLILYFTKSNMKFFINVRTMYNVNAEIHRSCISGRT